MQPRGKEFPLRPAGRDRGGPRGRCTDVRLSQGGTMAMNADMGNLLQGKPGDRSEHHPPSRAKSC